MILFKRTFGWKNIFYIKKNVTESRPCKEDIPKLTVTAIEKYNKLDIELYRYAKDMFDRLISKQDSSFEREVNIFRLRNKLYNKIHPSIRRIGKVIKKPRFGRG